MTDTLHFTQADVVKHVEARMTDELEDDWLAEDWLALHARVAALEAERDQAWDRLNALNAQIHDLSHPNCQMLLRDKQQAEARVTRLAEALRQVEVIVTQDRDVSAATGTRILMVIDLERQAALAGEAPR